jgi:MFS family permease
MQITAQDWLVLTELTDKSAHVMGIVMALQFFPQILLVSLTGSVADRFDRRKVIICTQVGMAALALVLGLITVSGIVELWHVYVLAFLLGCVASFDAPARQSFVSELVPDDFLSNAVALNSTTFNSARMIGPAVAGILIAVIGSGWIFVINAFSFAPLIFALSRIRIGDLNRRLRKRSAGDSGSFIDGLRYLSKRSDLKTLIWMMFFIGTFGLNFAIYISSMAVNVFHTGSGGYGMLTSLMAVGSLTGALYAANRSNPSMLLISTAALCFGLSWLIAAFLPYYLLFGLIMIFAGLFTQTFNTSIQSLIQLSTEPEMRGRVLSVLMAVAMGGTPVGAPLAGWVSDTFGSRYSLGIAVISGFIASAIGFRYLCIHGKIRKYHTLKVSKE